jgi:surfactin synthase thioesterase subunit
LCKQKKILEAIFAIFGEPDHEHSKNQICAWKTGLEDKYIAPILSRQSVRHLRNGK